MRLGFKCSSNQTTEQQGIIVTVKRWLGQAASTFDLWTINLSGTVTSQNFSLTINGKSLVYASSGGDTVATVLAALVALWNRSTPANPPEFQELTAAPVPATGSAMSMTIIQDTAGIPSTITVSTGGAATFSITNTTAATGPNFFDNSQNWSGGVAPANGDTLVFDNGSVDCCYGLSTSLTTITLNAQGGYSGNIGLPLINAVGQSIYSEYRTTYLTLAGGTAVINCAMRRCNLAFGANLTTVRVLTTGQRIDPYTPVVLIAGGNGSSELDVSKGDVGIAFYQGTTANFPTIKTSYLANTLSDVSLICGSGATLGTIIKTGGSMTVSANATTITQDVGGGTMTVTDSVTVTTLNVYDGTVNLNSIGAIATINLYGAATLSADGDPRAKTITNPIEVFSESVSVIDTQHSINSGVLSLATNGCESVKVRHGGNTSIVYT